MTNFFRIFSEKIVPNFENDGAEFNGILIEWNNKNESDHWLKEKVKWEINKYLIIKLLIIYINSDASKV